MGKASLFMIAAFVVASSYTSAARTSGGHAAAHRVGAYETEVLARNAALAGFERVKQGLTASFTGGTSSGTYEGATFETTTTVVGSRATATVIGHAADGKRQDVAYKVVGTVERQAVYPVADEAPAFLQFALATEDDLTLNGNILVDTFRVEGDDAAAHNANMHTNGRLEVKGNAALVRGFGTAVTGWSVNKPANIFQPYNNPTATPVVRTVARVEIPPALDVAAIAAAHAYDRSTSGALVLNGTYDFEALGATRDDPYVWYVNGPVTVQGTATMKGYVLFVATGDIAVTGNANAQLSTAGPRESSVGYYTASDLTLGGNVQMYGQFFAAGDVRFHGTPRIYGSVTARGTADVSGTPSIYYTTASPALTRFWQTPQFRLHLAGFNEGL